MEKRKKKRHTIDSKKKLVLVIDGVLLIALIAAIVVLSITLFGEGGAQVSLNGKTDGAEAAANEPAEAQSPAAAAAAVTANAEGGLQIDFAQLKSGEIPAVAYIKSEGTAIDYPVVQNIDNEYYMSRDMYGKKSESGAIFLDSRNTTELLDDQVIIYGNPMADGSMFGSLTSYRDMAYYEAHPSLMLYTEGGKYRIDVYAAHTASPAMANYPILFMSAEERAAYIASVRGQSFFQTNVEIADDARLISLVTCAEFDAEANACFVVHGVLIPE